MKRLGWFLLSIVFGFATWRLGYWAFHYQYTTFLLTLLDGITLMCFALASTVGTIYCLIETFFKKDKPSG